MTRDGIEGVAVAMQEVSLDAQQHDGSCSVEVLVEKTEGSSTEETFIDLNTPSGAPFKSRYGPSANPKNVAPFTFGQRLLSSEDNPWDYNAWDHATPDSEYLNHMATQIETQKSNPVSSFDKKRFHAHPDKFWNKFYTNNSVNFFKDRKWLGQEFPLLKEACEQDAKPMKVLEVGAGAGNTLFPILKQNRSEGFHITAADFSAVSIGLIRAQEEFIKNHPKHVDAVVWDLADPNPENLPAKESSLDIIILIFVFSALAPWQWRVAVGNVKRMLKPGGTMLFRDYGRGDLAQVRMKGGRWLGENFYVRGDGTRVYFFEEQELADIFEERWGKLGLEAKWEDERKAAEGGSSIGAWGGRLDGDWDKVRGGEEAAEKGLNNQEQQNEKIESSSSSSSNGTSSTIRSTELPTTSVTNTETRQEQEQQNQQNHTSSSPSSPPPPLLPGKLIISKIGTDRRMLVNRKRQLKMYRCWLQMQCGKEL